MSDKKSVAQEFAWRLMDRFLPDTSERSSKPSGRVRYGASFLGAATWGVMLLVYLLSKFVVKDTPDSAEVFSAYPDSDWVLFLLVIIVVYLAMFSILIGASVRRGTALNFYLWGLSIPVVVTNLLNFTFGVIE